MYVATDVELPSKKGSSTHTLEVASSLQALGCEVSILSRRSSRGSRPRDQLQGIEIFRIFRGILLPLGGQSGSSMKGGGSGLLSRLYDLYLTVIHAPYSAMEAVRIIESESIDAVIERGSSLGAGAIAAMVTGKPLLTEVIDYRHTRISLRLADRVIAYRRDILKADLPPDRLTIVPAGANTTLFRPRRGDGHLVGYAGSFRPWHGVEDLVAAARILKDRNVDARFLMIGPGNEAAKESAKLCEVDDRMDFTGGLDYERLPESLGGCGILVAPFNPEKDPYMRLHGFIFSPLKIFEYMSLAKAVVASDLDKIRDVIADRQTGHLVSPGSPEEIADAIEGLISDHAEAIRIGRRARRTIINLYSWDRLSRLIFGALRKAIA